jgi:Amt family ammonium transporter
LAAFFFGPGDVSTALVFAEGENPAVAAAAAMPAPPTIEEMVPKLWVAADTVWVLVCGMLVFFMNLGFAAVESGMCRAKNCVNILSKNFIVFAVSSMAFWIIGFDLMFGANTDADMNKYLGSVSPFLKGEDNSPATLTAYKGAYGALNWSGVPLWAKFFFQLVFTGTAATIVSGAVAERIKYLSFIVFSFIMGTAIYPIVGHWIWGGGFLATDYNFFDFAGSTQVHSVGGWAALAGVIVLGARKGKYTNGSRSGRRCRWRRCGRGGCRWGSNCGQFRLFARPTSGCARCGW